MDLAVKYRALLAGLGVAILMIGCQMPTSGGSNVALLYGISTYDDLAPSAYALRTPNLKFPALDVLALQPLLSSANGGIFSVTARTDRAATKAQMQADILAAAAVMDETSLCVFYFGGHGDQGYLAGAGGKDGHAYILPYGAYSWQQSPPVDATQIVTEDDLKTMLSILPTKKIVVILDACYSAGFLSGKDGLPADSGAYYAALWKAFLEGKAPGAGQSLADWLSSVAGEAHLQALTSWNKSLAAGSGFAADQALVLAAAGALEESYDAEKFQHGAFTYFLLQAKNHGDYDNNGVVTVSEAYRYAFEGIQTQWNGIWGAVGEYGFAQGSNVFLPHLSTGPVDYVLFKR